MKQNIINHLALGVLSLGLASTAQAGFIQGGVTLKGTGTYIGGDVDAATGFQSFSGVTVDAVNGSYVTAGVQVGDGVTMTAFSFKPLPAAAVIPLWMIPDGPSPSFTALFDLLSISIVSQGNGVLKLQGQGTLHLTGFDNTPGSWEFTSGANDSTAPVFHFSSGTVAVPDGGLTLSLLGMSLFGLAWLRRTVS